MSVKSHSSVPSVTLCGTELNTVKQFKYLVNDTVSDDATQRGSAGRWLTGSTVVQIW